MNNEVQSVQQNLEIGAIAIVQCVGLIFRRLICDYRSLPAGTCQRITEQAGSAGIRSKQRSTSFTWRFQQGRVGVQFIGHIGEIRIAAGGNARCTGELCLFHIVEAIAADEVIAANVVDALASGGVPLDAVGFGTYQLQQFIFRTGRENVDIQAVMQDDDTESVVQALSQQAGEFGFGCAAVAMLRGAMGEVQHDVGFFISSQCGERSIDALAVDGHYAGSFQWAVRSAQCRCEVLWLRDVSIGEPVRIDLISDDQQ